MTEFDIQAHEFLKKANAQVHISRVGEVKGFPFDNHDTFRHYKYNVMLIRGKDCYRYTFYDSANNYMTNKRPSRYDVLACLVKYEVPYDVKDFAAEYGYEIDDDYEEYKRVTKIHQACKTQYRKLLDLFGYELMAELQEIN